MGTSCACSDNNAEDAGVDFVDGVTVAAAVMLLCLCLFLSACFSFRRVTQMKMIAIFDRESAGGRSRMLLCWVWLVESLLTGT